MALKIVSCPPAPRNHVLLSITVEGRHAQVEFLPDRTAVVEESVANFLLGVPGGGFGLIGDAPEGAAATMRWLDEDRQRLSLQDRLTEQVSPFPEELNPFTSAALRPSEEVMSLLQGEEKLVEAPSRPRSSRGGKVS